MPKSPIIVLLGLEEPAFVNEQLCPIIMHLNIVPWHGSQTWSESKKLHKGYASLGLSGFFFSA